MAVQQPAHRQPMGGQFPGHLGQQQRPLHHPIRQVVAHIGEAQPDHAGGDALLGVPSPLRCQPHPGPRQCRLYLPVPRAQLGGDPGMLWPVSQRAAGTPA